MFITPDMMKHANSEKVYSSSLCHLTNRPVQIHVFSTPKLEDITPDGKGKLGSGALAIPGKAEEGGNPPQQGKSTTTVTPNEGSHNDNNNIFPFLAQTPLDDLTYI